MGHTSACLGPQGAASARSGLIGPHSVGRDGRLRETEILALRTRLADFIADDDLLEQVEFRFAGDVDNETFRFAKRTEFNGLVEQEFRILVKKIERLLERDGKARAG